MKATEKEIDHSVLFRRGSAFDGFLREEGVLEETEAVAIRRVIAWQLQQEMRRKRITKTAMAARLGTSRSQLDRLLDPKHTGVTIVALAKAAKVVGKCLKIDVMDEQVSRIAWFTTGSQRGLGKTWGRKQHKLAAAK